MHPASPTRVGRARRARRTPRALPHLLGLLGLLGLGAPTINAQGRWPTAHQLATWLVVSAESPVTERTSLWFDGNWRRMGLGAEPQQVLLRPGVLVTLAPGLRAGAGYTYVATAP